MVCTKLGQLPPQRSNVLLVGVEGLRLTQDTLRAAMLHLQQRAERNEAAYLQRHRFRDRADFFGHHQRSSELLVRGPDLQADEPVIGWINPQAKYPLPGKSAQPFTAATRIQCVVSGHPVAERGADTNPGDPRIDNG